MGDSVSRKSLSFEEYWRASKAWEQRGLCLGTARALVNAGFVDVEDLQSVAYWELASIPRVGRKSLAILLELACRESLAASVGGGPQTHQGSDEHDRKSKR